MPSKAQRSLEGIKDVKIHKHPLHSVAERIGTNHVTLSCYAKILDDANLGVSSVDDKVLVEFLSGNSTPGAKPVSDLKIKHFFE